MATCNFKEQYDFGLWVKDFSIPIYEYDEETDTENTDEIIDYDIDWYAVHETENALDELNGSLEFYQVVLRDGYYSGTQLYVEEKSYYGGEYWKENPLDYTPQEWHENRKATNYSDCILYYPDSYSVALRKVKSEISRINKWAATVGKKLGFEEYVCTAHFSNGEACYERADNERARLKSAARGLATV